jgi:hypothetical protein
LHIAWQSELLKMMLPLQSACLLLSERNALSEKPANRSNKEPENASIMLHLLGHVSW